MSGLSTILFLLLTFLAVFAEVVIDAPRHWLGAQLNLLAPLVVCAGLSRGIGAVAVVGIAGGLWTDAVSANPFGVSVLPLFWVGLALHGWRDLILRQVPYAQCVLGALAAAAVMTLTLVLLLTLGERPLLGWGTLWQLLVVSLGGAALTPSCLALIERLHRLFAYPPAPTAPFPSDREIKRGRY